MTDTIDLDKLEQVARAATPGPWKRGQLGWVYVDTENETHAVASCQTKSGSMRNWDNNEEFIAQANPAVVLELVRRLRAAEADVKRLTHMIESECVIQSANNTFGNILYWLIFPNTGEHQRGVFSSPREAIDADIAAQGASHD